MDKVQENRVRRSAKRVGLVLERSRSRDPRTLEYGHYRLVDAKQKLAVYGTRPVDFSATLNECEDFLAAYKQTP